MFLSLHWSAPKSNYLPYLEDVCLLLKSDFGTKLLDKNNLSLPLFRKRIILILSLEARIWYQSLRVVEKNTTRGPSCNAWNCTINQLQQYSLRIDAALVFFVFYSRIAFSVEDSGVTKFM